MPITSASVSKDGIKVSSGPTGIVVVCAGPARDFDAPIQIVIG